MNKTEPTPAPDTSILTWRENMGLSQADAAEALGCSRTSIGHWEREPDTTPRYIKLAMAALALGIKAEGRSDPEAA